MRAASQKRGTRIEECGSVASLSSPGVANGKESIINDSRWLEQTSVASSVEARKHGVKHSQPTPTDTDTPQTTLPRRRCPAPWDCLTRPDSTHWVRALPCRSRCRNGLQQY